MSSPYIGAPLLYPAHTVPLGRLDFSGSFVFVYRSLAHHFHGIGNYHRSVHYRRFFLVAARFGTALSASSRPSLGVGTPCSESGTCGSSNVPTYIGLTRLRFPGFVVDVYSIEGANTTNTKSREVSPNERKRGGQLLPMASTLVCRLTGGCAQMYLALDVPCSSGSLFTTCSHHKTVT